MAEQSFPQIPSAVWWKVRNAFKKTVPARLTDTYLASILNVKGLRGIEWVILGGISLENCAFPRFSALRLRLESIMNVGWQ
jgi:hypothetical protein